MVHLHDNVESSTAGLNMVFSRNTEILTHTGWKQLAKIPKVNPIRCLCIKKPNIVELTEVSWVEVWPEEQTIWTSQFHDIVFSSDTQPWFIHSIPFFVEYNPTKINGMDDAFFYLMGIILTDAYYTRSKAIEIYQSEKKCLSKILRSLDILKMSYKDHKIGETVHHRVYISKKDSQDTFIEFLKDRKNPSYNLLLHTEGNKLRLLEGLMDGDGTWNNGRNSGTFYKPSLLNWFQPFVFSLGYRTTMHEDRIKFARTFKPDLPDYFSTPGKWSAAKLIYDENYWPILRYNGKIFTFSP